MPERNARREPGIEESRPAQVLHEVVPLVTKLVWPALIIALILIYHPPVSDLVHHVDEALVQGRSVQLGEWVKIGERTSIGTLASASAGEIGRNIDLSVSRVGGYNEFIEKSSFEFLQEVRRQLQASPQKRIDLLVVSAGHQYSTKLLGNYVSLLGIRFVIFENQQAFAGWIDSGLFNSQLPGVDMRWPYEQLRQEIIGIRTDAVPSSTSAVDVLKKMDSLKLENIAVVDGTEFKFIASREGIVAKLLVASISAVEAGKK